MSSFYKPISFTVESLPIILYPYLGIEERFSRKDKGSLEKFITKLMISHTPIISSDISYAIIILWSVGNDVMTDLWMYGTFESWKAGPTVFVRNFRNEKITQNEGVTAGDGLILLGREEEQRRNARSIEEYLSGLRPVLLCELTPIENFYQASV